MINHPDNIALDDSQEKDPDRLYMRWWYSLFPHIQGYYKDGHLNNWWKYFYSLDYVTNISNNDSTMKTVYVGDKVEVDCNLNYQSTKIERITTIEEGENIQISDTNIVDFNNGLLYAKEEGETEVTLNYDGKSIVYTIKVKTNPT